MVPGVVPGGEKETARGKINDCDECNRINESGYEIIDHTADVGIRACAPDLPRCFETTAMGMFNIISDKSRIEPKRECLVEIDADSFENALTDFLSELLFLFDTEGILFSDFSVELVCSAEGENREFSEDGSEVSIPSIKLKALCRGEPYDGKKHNYPVEIKAVTQHMLMVNEGPPAEISVLFDI